MFVEDPLTLVNLILCLFIVILGLIVYRRETSTLALSIAVAFGIFGISHLANLLGYGEMLLGVLIWIRSLAYVIIMVALLMLLRWNTSWS
jgi:hypothetical protein